MESNMKLTKEKDQFGTQVHLKEDENELIIKYGGTGDLYLTIKSNDVEKHNTISITKENYELYKLFDQLYEDVKNINLYEDREVDEEIYRVYNYANYNELFNKEEETLTWYSDETAHDAANILKIKKENDSYKVSFDTQPNIKGCDEDSKSDYHISIRLCNSGSRYYPFNSVFMNMYNNLLDLEDVNEYGHQIHMEEYLYEKEKAKTKVLKRA
jgi:hypothetical protein